MTAQNKPVAIVTTTVPLTVRVFYGEVLRQLGVDHEVHVVSSSGSDMDELTADGTLNSHVLEMRRDISPVNDVKGLYRWSVLIRQTRPSTLFAATPKASLLSLVVACAFRVPRRIYLLGGLRLEGARGLQRAVLMIMEKITIAAATDVVANSASLRDSAVRAGVARADRIRVTVPGSSHGVDAEHFSPRPRDMGLMKNLGLDPALPVVGFVGRLTHDKGIETLLSAAAILRDRGRVVQWLVIGPHMEPDSARFAHKLRSSLTHLSLVDAVRDVRPYYALMDIHVLPTLREGFPNVVLEAAAMGIPTITTDATGSVDSVLDGRTGIIFPCNDAAAFADAIQRLTDSPEIASQLGLKAMYWVRSEFKPHQIVASVLRSTEKD